MTTPEMKPLPAQADCPQCEGTGGVTKDMGLMDKTITDCPYCHGTGKYPSKPGPDTLAEKRGER